MTSQIKLACRTICIFSACTWATLALAQTQTLRVVTYNIGADINGKIAPSFGVNETLEGIGEEQVQGHTQPLDILALEETTSNELTVDPIVGSLNDFYSFYSNSSAVYARSPIQGLQNGSNAFGNGPNALIYNTKTLQLVDSVGVGTPLGSLNGEYRQAMRYQFQPVGGTAANRFYVYVTHMKSSFSGDPFVNESLRNREAHIIRADADSLPTPENPHPSILYVGDFNLDGTFTRSNGSTTVSAYQTMTAPGAGKAVDPFNPSLNYNVSWASNPTYASILSESVTNLRYRDDLQLMTQNVLDGTAESGLKYIPGSMHTFGNDGSIGVGGYVYSGANTAFANIDPLGPIPGYYLSTYLYYASDHYPVVADYTIPVSEPAAVFLMVLGGVFLLSRKSGEPIFWRFFFVAPNGQNKSALLE